jgi:two-component system, cell cycle sensor histidine kinase and response regulator CckA
VASARLTEAASRIVPGAPDWRAEMLNITLRFAIYLGVIAGVPSVYMATSTGLPWIGVLDVVVLAMVVAVARFERIPYVWRAAVFCGAGFALGLGLLLAIGTFSLMFFVVCSVGATLLLGQRAGIIATVLGTATIMLVGVAGWTGPEVILATREYYATRWIVIALNFALVSTLLCMGIGRVLTTLERALAEQIASRRSLEEERALLRTFIDTLPDVVFTKDTQGRFVLVNPATLAVFRLQHDSEMIGKTVHDFYVPALAERLHRDDMAVIAGQVLANQEVNTRSFEGHDRWYLTLKAPIRDSAGAITGLIGISRDVTERRKLEEQLRQAQKMEAVGQLAGGVAHDFNNLLTIIFGYSDVLRAQVQEPGEMREAVDAIHDAAGRAAALTRQLLAFSRQTMLQPKVLDINETITSTSRMLSRIIGEDIQFSLVLDPSIAKVRVDPGQLDQVLMNLAVNSRDAMPQGGTLSITTQRVELTEAEATLLEIAPATYVRITVTDTGIGMPPEVQARIFEPFFTTKGVGTGTGLGLAMVFGIVRQSGGTIDVESAPGAGARFRIYLPAVPDAPAPSDQPAQERLAGSETVLLVEDDAGVRDLAVASLTAHGYRVLTASDGRDGLDVVAAHAGHIDLLVTDVVMPRMGGSDLAAQLRLQQPDVRVLFMSGYTDDAVVRQGVLHSEVAFLHKPFTMQALAAKVRAVLDAEPLAPIS